MKKIIHINTSTPLGGWQANTPRGWAPYVAKTLKKYYPKCEIECWSPESATTKYYFFKENGITFRFFPSVSIFGRELSLSLLNNLKEEIKKNSCLLHLHAYHNWMGYAIASLFGNRVPIVAQHHGDRAPIDFSTSVRKASAPLLLTELFIERFCLKKMWQFFVLSDNEKNYLAKFAKKSVIKFQPLPINTKIFRPTGKNTAKQALNIPHNTKLILTVASLSKLKGIEYLLHALPKIRENYNCKLIILGKDRGYKKILEQTIDKLKINDFVTFNWIDKPKILAKFYSAANVFVLPSLSEGAPVSIMEALSCGLPVIATKVGGIPKILANQNIGVLVEPANPKALADAIKYVFKNYKKFNACRTYAKNHFDEKIIALKTKEIYETI